MNIQIEYITKKDLFDWIQKYPQEEININLIYWVMKNISKTKSKEIDEKEFERWFAEENK